LAEASIAAGSAITAPCGAPFCFAPQRAAALRGRKEDGLRFLGDAQRLAGPLPTLQRGHDWLLQTAERPMQFKFSATQQITTSRSVLLGIIATARDDDAALTWFEQES
jgi:hypothetical protein